MLHLSTQFISWNVSTWICEKREGNVHPWHQTMFTNSVFAEDVPLFLHGGPLHNTVSDSISFFKLNTAACWLWKTLLVNKKAVYYFTKEFSLVTDRIFITTTDVVYYLSQLSTVGCVLRHYYPLAVLVGLRQQYPSHAVLHCNSKKHVSEWCFA